ncbi:MAG: twin-arginine translocase TatA/TatE family subunit [Acidobacteriota bacterium]
MFGSLGIPEALFILALALLIFGPKRLPQAGRTLGKAMGEFRRASNDLRRTLNTEIALEEEKEAEKNSPPALQPTAGGEVPSIQAPSAQAEMARRQVARRDEVEKRTEPAAGATPPKPASETSPASEAAKD